MIKDKRVLQAGLGTFVCLDCLGLKKYFGSARCHSCAMSDKETRRKISVALTGSKNHMFGKHHKKESLERISAANRHKSLSAEHRRKIGISNTGKHHSEETKAKISIAHMGMYPNEETRNKLGGFNCHFWRGGVNHTPYPKEFNAQFRAMIRDRDGHICQNPRCYKLENGKRHIVHHIDFMKANTTPENTLELCRSCHGQTNSGNREYRMEYYQNVQIMRGIL